MGCNGELYDVLIMGSFFSTVVQSGISIAVFEWEAVCVLHHVEKVESGVIGDGAIQDSTVQWQRWWPGELGTWLAHAKAPRAPYFTTDGKHASSVDVPVLEYCRLST